MQALSGRIVLLKGGGMQVPHAPFSLAGFWQPVDNVDLVRARGGGLVSYAGVVGSSGSLAESVVFTGWNFSAGFGASASTAQPLPIHVAYLAQRPDGRLAMNVAALGSDVTNGAGSVVTADFNGDGRGDIFLAAHNESPFKALASTVYLSNAAGTYDRVVLNDAVMAHDAELAMIGGRPAIVTRTFQPGDANPIYTFGAGGFQERTDARLSTATGGMSVAIAPVDAIGQQFAVVGDVGRPPSDPFKIAVYAFANGDITGAPVTITPYLSTVPQYSGFSSEWGAGVTHVSRVWTDDFNHDGRPDIVAGTSMWTSANNRFPSMLDLIQNDGNLQFHNVTARLNPDYSTNTDEVDYGMRMVDLDGSGINSYLLGRETSGQFENGAFHRNIDRQSNYLLVNDGTGRLHVALHDEFVGLAQQVRDYLANAPEIRAQGLFVPPDLNAMGVPHFVAYRTADGHLNYVADVILNRWANNDPASGIAVPVHALVNVPINFNLTTDIKENYTVADRNGSHLIRTFAGNDVLADTGASGPAHLDGGLGLDVARYAGARASYQISQAADGVHVASLGGAPIAINDTLVNIERLQFSDGVVGLDIGGNAGSIYRLYQAAFGRVPDTGGLSAHIKALDHGVRLHDDAATFLTSPEFALRYGSAVNDESFVNLLYRNVLGRDADPAGLQNWTANLSAGALDRAGALVGFSESVENHAKVDPTIGNGIQLDYSVLG